MPKNNQEEYEVLKELKELGGTWEWIARDENDELWAFESKPRKTEQGIWRDLDNWSEYIGVDGEPFQFIQWEDEEPYNIAELIEEYEIENGMRYDFGKIKVVDIDTSKLATRNGYIYVKESEETEVKDLEWLRKEFDSLFNGKSILTVGKSVVDEILDQLDEPEVLSQELPVMPKFVADFIEEVKPDNSLRVAFEYIAQRKRDNHDDELAFWVEEGNSETFARAWLDGFTVEKEQKYYIRDQHGVYLLAKNHREQGKVQTVAEIVEQYGIEEIELDYELTEQEIKDYDPRYMTFAKLVEELEE